MFPSSFLKLKLTNHRRICFRLLRNVSRRDGDPKVINGTVKTIAPDDDPPRIESYKDFISSIRGSKLGDELEVEREFLNEDYHGDVFERCDKVAKMHKNEESFHKMVVKNKIVGRKYFKLDKETNLLTYAAKAQIRFLHKLNPLDWNCKALSECFPISESGVKKLLKCNFVITCPERIKAHDEEVAERWKLLKSGKPTDLISPLTQKLYKEGKLADDFYSGNPNLPIAVQGKKVIEMKRKKMGEFSAIIKTYVEHEKRKLLTEGSNISDENQVAIRNKNTVRLSKINTKLLKGRFESEEIPDRDPEVFPYRCRKKMDDYSEIPFSQFKEILKDETGRKLSTKKKDEYDEFVMQEASKVDDRSTPIKPITSQDCFVKISKYDKDPADDLACEEDKSTLNVYKYDAKLGYQYPFGKSVRGKINLPPSQREKRKLHKIGQCVYDSDGEFLYKVPT